MDSFLRSRGTISNKKYAVIEFIMNSSDFSFTDKDVPFNTTILVKVIFYLRMTLTNVFVLFTHSYYVTTDNTECFV